MKKFIIIFAFISFAMMSHAQWFTGGSAEYSSTSDKNNNGSGSYASESKKSQSGFSFAPMIGYQTNRFAFGGSIIINTATDTDAWSSGSHRNETKDKTTLWGVQPFVRYTFMEFGNFSVFANTGLHLLTGNSKQTSNNLWTTDNEIGITSLGINVVPVLSYRLSEKINLEAGLNFMNFGWNSVTEEDKQNSSNSQKTTVTDFGLGVNSGNAANVGAISIGFVYKFGGKRVL